MSKKAIGVLTSGGDAPGMNAAIRAVVRTGIYNDFKVFGVYRGFNGLIHGDIVEMSLRDVSDKIHLGGTMLRTARSAEFATEEGMAKAIKSCRKVNLDGLVVIGGDGSFRGARDLSERGFPCIGVPATIDNDISCSDYTIGYDTALNTATQMIDRLRDTSEAHDRCSVVEVMGRRAGYLALNIGIAAGATSVIIPEIEYTTEALIKRINDGLADGKRHFTIVVAEGVGGAEEIAKTIQNQTGIESRATILGHVQRGGSPSVRDRVLASQMGNFAVELLSEDIGNKVVVIRDNKIIHYDISEALKMSKEFDYYLYKVANEISI